MQNKQTEPDQENETSWKFIKISGKWATDWLNLPLSSSTKNTMSYKKNVEQLKVVR